MTNPAGGPRIPNQPFQENGEWRSYDTAGRLLRWDERAQTWMPLPAESPPTMAEGAVYAQQGYGAPQYRAVPAAGQYRFASLRTPAVWVYVLLGIVMLATVLYAIGAAMQYSAIGALEDASGGDFFTKLEDIDNADDVITAGIAIQGLAQIGLAGVFIWWVRRATCNVFALGAADPQFTPGWAIGWWFIPFANLVQPLRVINQAWRASDLNAIRSGDPRAWKTTAVSGIVLTWWLVWQISWAVSGSAYSAYDGTENLDTARDAAIVIVIGEIGMLVAGALAFIVVRQLTQRHEIAGQVAGDTR